MDSHICQTIIDYIHDQDTISLLRQVNHTTREIALQRQHDLSPAISGRWYADMITKGAIHFDIRSFYGWCFDWGFRCPVPSGSAPRIIHLPEMFRSIADNLFGDSFKDRIDIYLQKNVISFHPNLLDMPFICGKASGQPPMIDQHYIETDAVIDYYCLGNNTHYNKEVRIFIVSTGYLLYKKLRC
jgi:hypothetical protein